MNYILITVLVILVAFAIVGLKMGFVKMVFSLLSTVIVIILTLVFSSTVSGWLKESDWIYGGIQDKLTEKIQLDGVIEEGMTQADVIEELPIPGIIKSVLLAGKSSTDKEIPQAATMEEYLVTLLSGIIINALGFVLTFVIGTILMFVLCRVLDILSRLPVLHQLNAVLGAAVGVVEGLLAIWVLFAVLTMFTSTSFGQTAMEMIGENVFLNYLYNNNIITKAIVNISTTLFK